jgi:hypothetical protein
MVDEKPALQGTRDITFISAFESSLVHCLKSHPSGNHRNPGNGGTAEIFEAPVSKILKKGIKKSIPMINILNDFICTCSSMGFIQICIDPHDEVVLGCALDNLMQ